MICRLSVMIDSTVSYHSEYDSQESSSHSDVSFCLDACSFDDSLSGSFLESVGTTQNTSSFADSPSECSGACLCDMSSLSSVCGLFIVGRHTSPKFESVSVRESAKVSDLGSDDASPYIVYAGNSLEKRSKGNELFGFVCKNDLSFESSSFSFEQDDEIEEIGKASLLDIAEQFVISKEPSMSGYSGDDLWSFDIFSEEYGTQMPFCISNAVGQLSPVSCELPQISGLFVSDPSERAFTASESFSYIEGIVSVGFSSFSSEICEFGSVSDIDSIDIISEFIDEPFDEADSFDSQMCRFRLVDYPASDFVDRFGIEGFDSELIAGVIDSSERNGAFVQVDTDEGVTLIELLVVVAIIAVLVAILLPSLSKARNRAKLLVCMNVQKGIGSAFLMYANDNNDMLPDIYNPASPGSPLSMRSFLWNYVGREPKAFLCPSDQGGWGTPEGPQGCFKKRGTSYAFNNAINWTYDGKFVSIQFWQYPSRRFVIFDTNWGWHRQQAYDLDAISLNVLFLDWHVESMSHNQFYYGYFLVRWKPDD